MNNITVNKTILLVEDEAVTSLFISNLLKLWGYDVIKASSGDSAVDAAAKEQGLIDLILMDIDLGEGIHGPEAAQQILSSCDVPIVFHTSHDEREMVEKVRGITRYGYVIKNSGSFVLQSSIEMALELFYSHKQLVKTTKSLIEQEVLFNQVFNQHSAVMLLIDPQSGRIIDANHAAEKFYGYCIDELCNNFMPEIPQYEVNNGSEIFINKNGNSYIYQHKVAGGDIKTVEVYSSLIHLEGKKRLFSIIHDITEKCCG